MKAALFGCIFLVALISMGITIASAEVTHIENTIDNLTASEQIKEQLPVSSAVNTSDIAEASIKIHDTTLQLLMDQNYRKTMDMDLNQIDGLINDRIWVKDSIHGEMVVIEIHLEPGADIGNLEQYLYQIRSSWPEANVIVATVPLKSVNGIALLPEVRSVNLANPGVLAKGSVTTQGDSVHRTNELRATYGANGANKKIGVISDGVSNLSRSIVLGDLPADVHVLQNRLGGDEGTAMLEIINDMAPSATLYFHDKGLSKYEFRDAFNHMIANGTNIICDDVIYYDEPFFEDGDVASYINNAVSTNNIVMISSAGNNAQHHYQGMFYPNGTYHDFSRGGSNKDLFMNLPGHTTAEVILQWNDPWGQSSNDYNLYLYSVNTGNLAGRSILVQNGAGCNPYEYIKVTNNGGQTVPLKIMIQKTPSAASKVLELFTSVDGIPPLYPPSNVIASDSIIGHAAATNVISVSAVDQANPNGQIEYFADQGPSTIYYPSQAARNKPDIVGVDGVITTDPGGNGTFNPFWGTSAAAPHIAGIVGDIWSSTPSSSAQQLRTALTSSAVDLGATGFDYIYGYGRADGMRMFEQFQPPIWVTTTLDTTTNSGQYSSLKLNNGYPGIASSTPTTGQGLKYNWKDDSGWHMETIDTNGNSDASLAYNNGYPSVAYRRGSSYDYVNYAWKTGSGWTTENVNVLGSYEGTGESLAFSSGSPYISYCDRYTGTVYYAYKSGSTWQNNEIKYEQDLDYHSSLAFNNGYPGITYAAVPSGGAMMNVKQNNTHVFDPYPFQREEFVKAVNISPSKDATTLLTPMSLRYAWADGSGWHFETVDTGSNYEGGYSSLAYYNGYPRISYQEANSNLKYAWKDASGWHKEVVDSGTLGPFTSLSVDASGYPKISYSANGYLKYAYKNASGWHTQTVDTAGGSYSSSVVDTSGNHPKISYFAGGHLKYAYK